MDFQIAGKRALVCAASKGLGKAIAMTLAHEQVELFLCARGEETLKQAVQDIQAYAAVPIQSAPCDLSDHAERMRLAEAVHGVWPEGVDILIHNTGGPPPSRAEDTPLTSWEQGYHQLLESVAHLNDIFLPAMRRRHWGRIVAVTSVSVLEPIAGLAVSNGMRAAVTGMLKTLADEVATEGVTINCAAPGIIHTDRTEERIKVEIARHGGTREEYLSQWAKSIPMGRLGTPDEYAAAVAFLCSQQASYVTGSTWCIDGGKRRSAT
jgi:3-oxoacyl-[acyl-carrier protein] reductase